MDRVVSGNRLDEILASTRETVARRKAVGLPDLPNPTPARGFRAALELAVADGGFGLITEIKRASPSKGLIRHDFDPLAHARAYAAGGAICLSVLTDEAFFRGSLDDLVRARAACTLPVLRKDFMVDPWQVGEARAYGADAILIIVAALDDDAMADIEAAAQETGMDVLIEVHDRAELDRALRLRSRLIGINTRDLRDFSVDPRRAWELAPHVPGDVLLVAESGLRTHADLTATAAHSIKCFLVGESLMRQDDLAAATRKLLGQGE